MMMNQAEADKTTAKIFSGFLVLVAAVFLTIGGHSYLRAKAFSENMASIGGKAVAVHENILQTKRGALDSVLIEAIVNGKTLQRYKQVDHDQVMVGDTVEVFYDRRDPEGTAYAGKRDDIWDGSSDLLVIGVLVAILAGAVRIIPPSTNQSGSPES